MVDEGTATDLELREWGVDGMADVLVRILWRDVPVSRKLTFAVR